MRLFARDVHPGLRSGYFTALGLLIGTLLCGVLAGIARVAASVNCSS